MSTSFMIPSMAGAEPGSQIEMQADFGRLVRRIMYSTSGPQQPLSNSKDEQSTTGGQVFCVPNHEWNRYKELASAAHKEGNLTQAEAMWLAALAEAKSFNAKDDRLAHTLDSLASFYYSIGRHEQAELFCKRALEVTTEAYGAYSIKVAACLNNLAGIYYNQRRYADAEPLCVRLISIYEYNYGADHADVGMALTNLAMLYHAQGKLQGAEKLYQRAANIRVKTLGTDHPCVVTLLENLAKLLRQMNKVDDADLVGSVARQSRNSMMALRPV